MKTKAPNLFDEAVQMLQEANNELCRPEEDVVSYLVCKNSQYAIENFLKGFLLKNGIEPAGKENINSLYKKCVKLNNKFKQIELNDFTCKGHRPDSRSCSEPEKVSKCYVIADKIDSLLRSENILA